MRHSQALEEAGYDARTRVLRVRFRDGGRGYDYLDVAPEVFEGLLASPHPWTEWGARIRAHRFRRL